MRKTLLSSFTPHGQVLHLMIESTNEKLQKAKAAIIRARFDAEESERLLSESTASLQTLIATATQIEVSTCCASSSEVVKFVEKAAEDIQDMKHTIIFCNEVIKAGNNRKRKIHLEN